MKDLSDIIEIKNLIVATLEHNKAENIVVIDLDRKSDIADFMIIATGRSNRHVKSVAELIIEQIKNINCKYLIEGMNHSDWVLIDTLDIIVHILTKEKRELYSLEQLWQN